MSMNFIFDRDRALEFQRCFEKSKPIDPPGGRWTVGSALELAGAALAAYRRPGPYPYTEDEFNALPLKRAKRSSPASPTTA
jgi:hypothetical protein